MTQQFLFRVYTPKRNESRVSPMCIAALFHNRQKGEAAQVSADRWIHAQWNEYKSSLQGSQIRHRPRHRRTLRTYAKCNWLGAKGRELWDSTYMRFLEGSDLHRQKVE